MYSLLFISYDYRSKYWREPQKYFCSSKLQLSGGVDGGGSAVVFSKTNSYSVPLLRVLVHSAFHMMLIVQHSAAISACTNNELGK